MRRRERQLPAPQVPLGCPWEQGVGLSRASGTCAFGCRGFVLVRWTVSLWCIPWKRRLVLWWLARCSRCEAPHGIAGWGRWCCLTSFLAHCSHVCFGGEIAYGRALCGRSYVLTLIASVGVCRSALLVRHFIYQCPEHTSKSGRCPCCVAVWAGGVVGKSPRGCMAIPCKSSVDS